MRKLIAVIAIIQLSCGWNPFPKPPPPPPEPCGGSCPEYHQCDEDANQCVPIDTCPLDEWPWCKDVGQQCSSDESPCKTNPSSDPFYCEEAVKCQEPPPPPPPPSNHPCVPEGELVVVDNRPPDYHGEVFKATTYLGPMPGSTPSEKLDAVAEQLRKQLGQCVIRGIEAVFIIRDDGLWEENHTVSFGNAGWTNSGRGKYIGSHSSGPVPTGLLPDPRKWDEHAKYNLTKHNGKWDRTLLLTRVLPYCEAIGMGVFNGLPRASCPVRPEGHKHREWWEREVYGSYWECNGIPLEPCGATRNPNCVTNNPAQAHCIGHVKTCDASKRICAEGDW